MRLRLYAFFGVLFVVCAALLPPASSLKAQTATQFFDVYSATEIIANGTTTLKTGGGVLHSICFNTVGASSNTLTVYNNTAGSGTTLATFDTTQTGLLGCNVYDAAFSTGLTVVLATGTSAKVTFTYRSLT